MVAHLPKGWTKASVSNIAEIRMSGVDKKTVDGELPIRLCNYTDVFYNERIDDSLDFMPATATQAEIERFTLQQGDVLLTKDSETADEIAECAVVTAELPGVLCGYHLALLSPHEHRVLGSYLAVALRERDVRYQFAKCANGVTRFGLTVDAFDQVELRLPPIKEQSRIVKVLDASSRCIQSSEALVNARLRCHAALVHELYESSERQAKPRKLGSVLAESREAGRCGDLASKLTVKLYGKGVIAKSERLLGSDQTQYYARCAGQLIYSQLDFLNGAIGIIPNDLDGFESTADLPSFDIASEINPAWLLGYLTRPGYYERRVDIARGQRIARRVKPRDFLESEIRIPSRSLQDRIAKILSESEKQIDLAMQLREATATEQRGLMQKLLTGEWRLAHDLPETEAVDVGA